MAAQDVATERTSLIWSIVVSTMLGVIGIVAGLLSGSQMILLDGVYGFIGVAVSWLLLRASSLAGEGPSKHYPYGRQAATPIVIGIQGFVLLATLLYAAVQAINSIVDGGSDVAAGWAVLYGAVSTVASFGTWAWLRRRTGDSDLVCAETTAWRVAALRGFGIVVGFGILWLILRSSWRAAGPYVDPAMVLVTCVAFLSAPIKMVKGTIVELLEGVPPSDVQGPVLQAVREVQETFDLNDPVVRMTKLGPKLYVEVDVVVQPDVTIAQEDEVRADLRRRLSVLPYAVWLNVELSADPTWGEL